MVVQYIVTFQNVEDLKMLRDHLEDLEHIFTVDEQLKRIILYSPMAFVFTQQFCNAFEITMTFWIVISDN